MKVRMKIKLNGLLDDRSYPDAGEVMDVADVAGMKLCAKGYAEPVAEPQPDVETATPPERNEKRGRK
ncbi:MAG: hypothetical protein ACRD1X_04095 [Vicinamibacteria bacterium]